MKSIKKRYLNRRIIFINTIIILATTLLYIVVILMMRQIINAELHLHNESMLDVTVNQIQETVELPLELMKNIQLLIEKNHDLDGKTMTDYLETIQVSYDYFTEIYIISLDGIILNTAPYDENIIGDSAVYEPYFVDQDMEVNEQYWSDVYISNETGMPILSITIMESEYLLVIDLDLQRLPIALKQDNYFEEIQTIAILDQWGIYIASEDFENVKERIRYELFDELEMNNLITEAVFYDEYNVAYSVINNLNWYIVVDFDYDKIHKKLNQISLVLFIAWMLLIGFTMLYIRRYFKLVTEELTYLKNRANSMINNDYNTDEESILMSFIELDLLNDDFTIMKDAITKRENKILSINKILKQSVEKAESANKAKSTFLSIMSHEMRTPLNGIIGFIQMLEKTDLNSEQSEIMSIVDSSSKTLVGLINNILDVEKYAAGKMIFQDEIQDLRSLLSSAFKSFDGRVKAKGVLYSVEMNESLNQNVFADELKIKQLIANLLSNAIKFTAKGSISVKVNSEVDNESLIISFAISDTGIGIKDEVKPYLFSPFTQADGTIAQQYGGTGLGLTICNEIVSNYNGTIDYKSVFGQGTTFLVNLQLKIADNTILLTDMYKPEDTAKTLKIQGKILVAEDNLVNQKLMSKYLEKLNIDFDMVENGQEALDRLKEETYELIFMDCQMPVMDGFEATKIIRKEYGNIMQIIAMTAYASKEDKLRCYKAGMNKFVTKPVDLEVLDEMLGISSENKGTDNPETELSILIIEVHKLMDKINFDYETSYDLMLTYVEQVKLGLDEIEKSYVKKEYEQISRKLHQLKGASAAVRIERMKKTFEKAEEFIKLNKITEAMNLIEVTKEDPLFK